MMLKVLSNPITLLVLYGVSLCQSNNDVTCTIDHDQALNENGVEVSVSVRGAVNTQDDGYWNLNFNNGKYAKIADIKAWCVDLGRTITGNKDYEVDVLSSLDANVTGEMYTDAVDKPEFLPSINWLMNNNPSGSLISINDCTSNHIITDQEFQLAVWILVDNHTNPDSYWGGENDQCVVNHLVETGSNNKNYEPDCLDDSALIGLLIIVDNADDEVLHQTLVAEIKLSESGVCECTIGAGVFGDPHFKTWAGEYYDFHGVCDLTLIKNPEFENGLGMDIQIRTTRMRLWSYISSAAIRIGEDILEIVGGQADNTFWINGIPGENRESDDAGNDMILTSTLSGYPINYKQSIKKQREFVIELGKGDEIVFSTWNAFVGVHVKNAREEHFQNSAGLMGSFPQGLKLARDNVSIMDNFNSFGQEWQVLASEPKLFHNIEGPQHPKSCEIPSSLDMRRRLEESTVTIKEATKACANVEADAMDLCVFDVMVTNDESLVGAY